MNNEKMGRFIQELRKSRKMTQKELANQLNITDKAVSKWERGLSCPDISLLPSLAEIFNVSTSELLNGEQNVDNSTKMDESVDNVLEYAGKAVENKARSICNICAIVYTALLAIGILVCIICDLALTGTLTWSLYPISSAVFAWLVLFPSIKWGRKGIVYSVASVSVLILPYLWILSRLVKANGLFMAVGVRASVISLVYLWCVYILFRKLSARRWIAAGISFLLLIPAYVCVNFSMASLTGEPLVDVWDILGYCVAAVLAAVMFGLGMKKKC